MKKFVLAAIPAALVLSFPSVAKDLHSIAQPKIVGGAPAQSEDWPWMSALVYTGESVVTTLDVAGESYGSHPFTNSPSGEVSGKIVDCGIGDNACADATDNVCLIERGEINFSVKVENCEAGGGVGAIIYNNVEGDISGTLGDDFAGTIPAVAITQADGQSLLTMLGEIAEIDVSTGTSLTQDSTCGASFLGGKWVLTASHCVDDVNIDALKVNVGEFDLSDGAENAVSVKRIYMHPDYDDGTLDNDVALIELTETVDAPAVTLANEETTDTAAQNSDVVTVIGWGGRTGYEPGEGPTGDFPDVLHQVDLNLMTNEECKAQYVDSFSGGQGGIDPEAVGISEQMICASIAAGGKSSCQGDSGGPLVLNTNEGWQQIGVVSWGIGCAAQGYPGVYARIAEFDDWLNGIYQGVAIEQKLDFNVASVGETLSSTLELTNNSSSDVTLSFSIDDSDAFSVAPDECTTIVAGESCTLTINYSNDEAGISEAELEIEADGDIATSSAKLVGRTISESTDVETALGANTGVSWFSGGEQTWIANSTDGGIESGTITDSQDSIVMATFAEIGELTFEWAVSSEENTDDPSAPYDALYLYVNGELVDFISGEVDYTSYTVDIAEENTRVTWVYNKDPAASDLDDKGYLRNVAFTVPATPVTPTPVTPTSSRSSSGGGSFGWMLIALFGLVARRVYK